MVKSNNNSLAMLVHILGWLTGFIGPLIMLLTVEDKNVKEHAKNVLNWQISLMIYMLISFVLIFVAIGLLFVIALAIMNMIICILGAVKASNGEMWNYPLAIPFL